MKYETNNSLLIQDIKAGNAEAYEFLFKTYCPRLKNFAMHFIADEDSANDIIQECFLKLWERRNEISDVSIRSMLFTMIRNSCLNLLKHEAIVNNHNVEIQNNHNSEWERLYYCDFLDDPDYQLIYDELKSQITNVLNKLPERSRQIFEMSRFEGKKNREISEKLGISVKVVERHISRALNSFREYFDKASPLMLQILLFAWLDNMK
jgi:RNA polymerase sigma-70 factor (family 1)